MHPETRREARERAARESAASNGAGFDELLRPTQAAPARRTTTSKTDEYARPVGKKPPRERNRRKVWFTLGILLIVVLALGVWLAFKVLIVKNELEAAQRTIATVQQDGGDMSAAMADLGARADTAASAAQDPVWRIAELVPFAGDNLRAVRLASETLDVVANDIAAPVLEVQASGEGGILSAALPIIEKASPTVAKLAAEMNAVAESGALVGPVRSGVDQIVPILDVAEPVLGILPSMLGADGEKRYLMAFQNNAESLPLGGSAASQTLITANAGDLAIAGQAGSRDFPYEDLDIDIDPGAAALYGGTYGERVNMSVTRPDWPSAAQMLAAFWSRDIDDGPIDGVMSLDPIALSRILNATGPITIGDVTLDSSNAVQILLSHSYTWWDAYTPQGAEASDLFFATVAATMFDKVASGQFNLMAMVTALQQSVDNGDLLLWSADAETQALLADERIAGILPTDNTDQTTVGIYYRDVSASKIDYYLKTAANVSMTCEAGTTRLVTSTTLNLDISQEAADLLPRYVQSGRNFANFFSKHVFIYAPPGMTVESVSVEGRDVSSFREGNVDLGRVVAPFQMTLRPGETATVTATFVGTGEMGPLEVRTTPMIHPTQVTQTDGCQ